MIISFEFSDSTVDLKVDLIDNPAIQSWKQHFLQQPLEVRSHVIKNTIPAPPNLADITMLYERCINNINQLRALGFGFEGHMPASIKDVDRNWCNEAHRFFTHTQKHVNHFNSPGLSLDEIVQKQKQLTSFLQELNDDIHLIEDYFLPNPYGPIDFDTSEIYCSKFPTYDDPGWWQMEEDWRQYHTDEHATVIFGPQILGKAISRSYLDGDNPNDWDTTGHYCNNGTLLIQVSNWRNDLYRSEPFQAWLKKWGKETTYYDFPVGHIKDKDTLNQVYQKLKALHQPIRTIYRNA